MTATDPRKLDRYEAPNYLARYRQRQGSGPAAVATVRVDQVNSIAYCKPIPPPNPEPAHAYFPLS